jgi:hypothetical protein
VIFTVTDLDLETNTATPHISIVALAGGEEPEIIFGQDATRPRSASCVRAQNSYHAGSLSNDLGRRGPREQIANIDEKPSARLLRRQ